MDESTLIEDIRSDFEKRGYDVEDGQGEWPLIVRGDDGLVFGISITDVSDYD